MGDGTGRFKVGSLKVEVYEDKPAAGLAAANATAAALRELAMDGGDIGAVFATGAAQFETLRVLTAMKDLPWSRVVGFHLDEYVGLQPEHPASFRGFLRERLTSKVAMKKFNEIDGTALDLERFCVEYAAKLKAANPRLCLLGIGENGHLAFNDPPVADFNDPVDVKIVMLDATCRQQQLAEGWFKSLDEVPKRALTLTIPAVMRLPKLIASVPGPRKAHIIYRALTEPISTDCPATILRTHPDCTVYLDKDSASEVASLFEMQAL